MPQTIPRKQVQRTVPAPQPPNDPLTRPQQPAIKQDSERGTRPEFLVRQQIKQVKTKPEQVVLDSDSEEEELSLESIVRDKPSPKKVAMFIQECVNDLIRDSDEESETEMEDSDFSRA
jgi:hypothetical protein